MWASLASLSACGGGGNETTPSEWCERFLSSYCQRSEDCSAASERANAYEDCTFVLDLSFDCKNVLAVGGSAVDCEHEVANMSCDDLTSFTFPRSCHGILLK